MSQNENIKIVCFEMEASPMNGKNIKSKGFTLVELLVVISIIALLLAVLMPALNKAREQAVKTICASNMKTTGTSMYMYLSDNKNTLPPDYMPPSVSGKDDDDLTNCFWQQKLIKYSQNGKVFTCSNYEKYFSTSSSAAQIVPQDYLYNHVNKDSNWYYWYCSGTAPSFGYNHRALGCGGYASGFGCYQRKGSLNTEAGKCLPVLQVKAEKIKNSSGAILCLDNVSSFAQAPPIDSIDSWNWWAGKNFKSGDPRTYGYHPPIFRHANGMNTLYVDCHAAYNKIDAQGFKFVSGTLDSCWGNCNQAPSF